MTISTEQLTSILRSTASTDGAYTPTLEQRLDQLVTVIDNADGQLDGIIAESSSFSLSGGVEEAVRQSLDECCSAGLGVSLIREVRRFVPIQFAIRSPFDRQPIPAPSEALSIIFEICDKKGIDAQTRNNGQYDLLDQPLATVKHYLSTLSTAGYKFSDNEQAFLHQHFGIDANAGFAFDPAITQRWSSRQILLGTGTPVRTKTTTTAEIPVEFNCPRPTGPDVDATIALFQNTFRRVAEAAEFHPDELPAKLIFVEESKTGINNVATGAAFSAEAAPRDLKEFAQACRDVARLYLAAQDRALTAEEERRGREVLRTKINVNFLRLTRRHWNGTDTAIFLPDSFFTLMMFAVSAASLGDSIKGNTLLRNVMAPIAQAFAHELVHIHEMERGLIMDERLSRIITAGVRDASPYARAFFGKCHVLTDSGRSLYRAWENGSLPSFITETAIAGAMAVNHARETNANHIGLYIAARAGYPPEKFSRMTLPDRPATLLHPAEGTTKTFLDDMASQVRAAGMVGQ